jgi:hypothetical protein
MATETLKGMGKLYDGHRYLCDVHYEIAAREGQSTRNGEQLDVSGNLTGIVRDLLYDLEGKSWTLHLDDGKQVNITVNWLTLSDVQNHRCQISVNSPL